MTAPVCHIPPSPPSTTQPGPKGIPAIPNPGPDIGSLLATVRALKEAVEKMSGQNNVTNNITINGFKLKDDKKTQWTEQSRVTDKVKIYQNNDPSTGNFVEVEQINKLTMVDKNTGQTWSWNRDR